MEAAPTLALVALLVILTVIVAGHAVRIIWREISGLRDDEREEQAERTEARKNRRIARELDARRKKHEP